MIGGRTNPGENRDLLSLVGRVYDGALGDDDWPAILNSIADFCGADNSALVIVDNSAGYSSVTTPRADPDVVASYGDYWWQHDPTSKATASAPVGTITTLADTGRDRFFGSTFYNDYWRNSGLGSERLASNLALGENFFASLVLQASSREDRIEQESFRAFEAILPHLVRAMRFTQKFRWLEQIDALAQAGRSEEHGIILVDQLGTVMHVDAIAEEILSRSTLLKMRDKVLFLSDPASDERMRRLIRESARLEFATSGSSGETIICGHDGRPRITIEVLPFRPAMATRDLLAIRRPSVILRVVDNEALRVRRAADFRQRFGLTGAEAALAVEMLAGDGRAAAAARCGISINTARTHLMRIFEKTGANRQAELVNLLLACARG